MSHEHGDQRGRDEQVERPRGGSDAAPVLLAARVGRTADDRAHAIRLACAPLIDGGAVTDVYPERCLAIIEEHGPYIVVAPGIALAHARPEDGVRRLGIAVVTLTSPVGFGHPENDPVDVVFAFGSPDADQHVGLLGSLARHLVDGLADRLRAAQDDATAQRVLEGIRDDV
jgi:ascorbate PTS system EIIA or EIIAB component